MTGLATDTNTATSINWQIIIWAEVGAFVGAAVVLVVALRWWRSDDGKLQVKGANGTFVCLSTIRNLPFLGTTYSFADSWASNVTLFVGLLSGIIGSSSVLPVIISDINRQASVTAASVIAVAVIGFAPAVLQLLRHKKPTKKDGRLTDVEYQNTVWGVIISATLTLGAGGGLAISFAILTSSTVAWFLAVLSCLILSAYGWRNMLLTLTVGKLDPKLAVPTPDQGHPHRLTVAVRRRDDREPSNLLAGEFDMDSASLDGLSLVDAITMPTARVRSTHAAIF